MKTSINQVHDIRTDLLMLRNNLTPQRDAVAQLSRAEMPIFKKETRVYLRDVYDHMIRVLENLDTHREVVTSLMEVQSTLVSNSLNEVIKVLTVIFTITIPASIITSAFGMNVMYPGFGAWEGLALALALMIGFSSITFLYLRRKGWV